MIFLVAAMIIIFICLFCILIPIIVDQMSTVAHDFWAARIAWREGKEKYMEYIKSHK